MNSITVEIAVRLLEDARAQLDMILADKATAEKQAIPPEVRAALADIDEEFAPLLAKAQEAYTQAEAEAKAAVIDHGATVKGQFLQVVWSKPRVAWDAKALDGYALNHPELFAFRTEGSPSASVRTMK